MGYFGGLRNIELRSIEFGKTFPSGEKSFEVDQSGYWFFFERGKQRGLPVVSSFCVPRRQVDWSVPVADSDRNPIDYDPASVIDHYLSLVELDLKKTRDTLTGGFFKSAHGKNARMFRNVPMGKNLIEKVGREFAEELFLPNPATFTSHCWRRSCGTNASDAGVNVTTLMSHLGWTTPKTAIGYVQKSRQTSFNVSMFLSNVQRENKDLDTIMELLKKRLDPAAGNKSSPEVRLSEIKSKVKVRKQKKGEHSEFDEQVASQFSTHLLDAGERDNVQDISQSKNSKIVRLINEESKMNVSLSHAGNGGGSLVGSGSGSGSGSGPVIAAEHAIELGSGGGVGVAGIETSVVLDPRVATILNNLQNHGQLHVHFHFGGK